MNFDLVFLNANTATFVKSNFKFFNCAIGIKDGKIKFVGNLPKKFKSKKTVDLKGKLVTPGFIDCHTHLIFAGSRSNEFEMRQKGMTYEQIAKQGGGIWSTVLATRQATEKELYNLAKNRVRTFISEGVTTLEIKSGYGLDLRSELKILRVAKKLKQTFPIDIQITFLGAHSIPKEFKTNPDAYIDLICDKLLPLIKKENLADAVDAFCENIAFSKIHVERLFNTAKRLGFPVKIHAEQLSRSGGSQIAAKFKAISADHLDFANENDLKTLKKSKTTPVLTPGTYYFLKSTKKPPVEMLRKLKIPFAISTDLNPGTSPINSLLIVSNLAINLLNISPVEAFAGVTINAAKALGLGAEIGTIETNKKANLVVRDVQNINEIFYNAGFNPGIAVVKEGKLVYDTLALQI